MNPNHPFNSTIKVAVVEDKKLDRENLVRLLGESPGFSCVMSCVSAEEAITEIPPCQPDVVLMDIQLPGISGIECIPRLKARLPDTQIMMLTIFEDHERLFMALAAGATGYLVKSASSAKLLEAIRELREGGAPMSGQIARQVVSSFQTAKTPAAAPAAAKLSRMEHEVLGRLARGLLYKEVAEELGISMGTVRTHIWHIYDKLQVTNRTAAVLKGLVH